MSAVELSSYLESEDATEAYGSALGRCLLSSETSPIIFLEGDLGAGKTTLSRGIMRAFGHSGAVKSPTYTIVEMYNFRRGIVYHFDLYRLADAEELEYMGMRDYLTGEGCCLIEWPERGAGYLPEPDLRLSLTVAAPGRKVRLTGCSVAGIEIAAQMRQATGESG